MKFSDPIHFLAINKTQRINLAHVSEVDMTCKRQVVDNPQLLHIYIRLTLNDQTGTMYSVHVKTPEGSALSRIFQLDVEGFRQKEWSEIQEAITAGKPVKDDIPF